MGYFLTIIHFFILCFLQFKVECTVDSKYHLANYVLLLSGKALEIQIVVSSVPFLVLISYQYTL